MDIQKIKYNKELFKNRIRLQKELKMVKDEIRMQQEGCDHVPVEMRIPDYSPFHNFRVCRTCVICGEKDMYPIKRLVDAKEYLRSKYKDDTSEEQKEEKFHLLQELTWQLIEENPSITEDELAVKLQKIVDKNIETIKPYQKTIR